MSRTVFNDNSLSEHGYHTISTEYEYEDAYYDREIKESYGFKTVKTYSYDSIKTDRYHIRNS